MSHGSGDGSEALVREAAHRLAVTMAPYSVLTRDKLAELSGASDWSSIGFDSALRWATDHNLLRRLDEDLYEIGPAPGLDEDSRRQDGAGRW